MLLLMDAPPPDVSPLLLREIAAHLPRLEIACTRCDRRERFYTDQLMAWYGRDKPVLDLLRELSDNCAWQDALPQQNACGAHFAELERP